MWRPFMTMARRCSSSPQSDRYSWNSMTPWRVWQRASRARRSLARGTTRMPNVPTTSTPSHCPQEPRLRFSGIAMRSPAFVVRWRQVRRRRMVRSTPTAMCNGSSV